MRVFSWSPSDSKSPQVSRTLLSILTDLNNVIIWMVKIRLLISSSFNPLSKPLRTVPSSPIIIGITVTLTPHNFLSSLARSKYLCLFSLSLIFTLWSAGMAKFTNRQVLFFHFFFFFFSFFYNHWVWIFWPGLGDQFVSHNPSEFYASHSFRPILVFTYTIW